MAVTVLDVAQLIGARMQGGTAEQAVYLFSLQKYK